MLKYLIYISLGITLGACSVTKSFYKDNEVKRYTPSSESAPAESEPAKKKPHHPLPAATPQTTTDQHALSFTQEPEETLPTNKPALPELSFGAVESANVRIPMSMNNPFPSSGELAIPLDELAADFCYPYPGKVISPFGYRGRSMHTGIDIKAIPNDTIRAAFSGVVRMSKVYSGYGNTIVLRHYNGIETLYSHNSKNLVSVNDIVRAGDPIALAGRTGRATTEHLHFEFRVASQPLNPTLLLDTENRTLNTSTLYCYNRNGSIRTSKRPLSENPIPLDEERIVSSNTPAGSSPKSTTGSKTTARESAVYHTIKNGDTLSALARKYSTSVAKICQLNSIKPTKILQLKERLRMK